MEGKKRKLQHKAMVVGGGGSSEKRHFTHLQVLMKLVLQGPERLGREFQAEHREVALCLVFKQPQVCSM